MRFCSPGALSLYFEKIPPAGILSFCAATPAASVSSPRHSASFHRGVAIRPRGTVLLGRGIVLAKIPATSAPGLPGPLESKPYMTSSRQVPEPAIQLGEAGELEESFPDSHLLFNETTRKYVRAYRQLEEQFEYLDAKLEETNNQLRQSLEEKDRVSKYLNNILESMSGGVLVLDLEGRITLFNQAAEEITGRSQEEVLGRRYEEVMGKDADGGKSALYTLESGTGLQTREKELRRADGRTIPLGFSSSLVKDHNGEILGALEAFNDLTEVKRLEAQVRRMHTLAALGEMAATVAHEIRNPLGGIASFANLLERDLDAGDPNRRMVSKITEGVARLNRIVSSLLSYTRPLNLNTRKTDVREIVEEAASFFEVDPEGGSGETVIERSYPQTPLVVELDTEQVHQVVLNLLLNAAQAMPDGGVVRIEVLREADAAETQIRIRDEGPGIDAAVREKLFTPFFTTKEDGTGLGLVTSKKIVEAHGGRITFQSNPCEGTCFTITLPH